VRWEGSTEADADSLTSSAFDEAGLAAVSVSGLEVDSNGGWSVSAGGSRVGVSNSVFKVMFSVSGLRTFAITKAPELRAPAAASSQPLGASRAIRCDSAALGPPVCPRAKWRADCVSRRRRHPSLVALGSKKGGSPWETPAGNGH